MNCCVRILVLVSVLPLALRGASLLLGNVVAVVVVSPPPPPPPSQEQHVAAGTGGGVAAPDVEHWRHRRRMIGDRSRLTAFTPREVAGGRGGGDGDEKRFAPTGSNPLHNL